MNTIRVCLALCLLPLLHGCFDSSKNETKDNTNGSKSSLQMQEGKAEQNK